MELLGGDGLCEFVLEKRVLREILVEVEEGVMSLGKGAIVWLCLSED